MSGAGSALCISSKCIEQACVGMRNCSRESRTPDLTAAIAACVRDGRRMAKTAKRAWFTRARPEAQRRETPNCLIKDG